MNEYYYDELMNIETCEEQYGFNKIFHYHRYEPTPYSALEELFDKYKVNSNDRIVDFGCGKGRLNFYINYLFDATVVGVEMNKIYYQDAIENLITYSKKNKDKINFHCCLAEDYEVNPFDNKFYFFNPFSEQIFIKVINNILDSFEKSEREIELIMYYTSEDYSFYLENNTLFELVSEIKIKGLYENNSLEKFLIYRLSK